MNVVAVVGTAFEGISSVYGPFDEAGAIEFLKTDNWYPGSSLRFYSLIPDYDSPSFNSDEEEVRLKHLNHCKREYEWGDEFKTFEECGSGACYEANGKKAAHEAAMKKVRAENLRREAERLEAESA